eukprot:m.338695 g.338695  ORF g.338695 m.338695 type:complete len:370 (+) comp18506_c0_seq1:156-1265(+)
MAEKYANLLKPGKLGDFVIKNRLVLASLTRARTKTLVPNEANVQHYKERAGFGLVITEATHISPVATGWVDAPAIYSNEQVEGWKKVVDAVHEEGGTIVCQLWHTGRASHSSHQPNRQQIVSASDIAIEGEAHTADLTKEPNEQPRPLTIDEIKSTVEDYGIAAANAKKAGFDGVEVHLANGYLPDQFLQSTSNKRTDQYGGSLENRFRFVEEILSRVIREYPTSRIGVKISPNGAYNGMGGATNYDDFMYYFQRLDNYRLAYMQVMDGLSFGFHDKDKAVTLADVKTVYTGAIMGNCGYTPESAEDAISKGLAEAVSFGRPTLANPDMPAKLAADKPLADMLDAKYWFMPNEAIRNDPNIGYNTIPKE